MVVSLNIQKTGTFKIRGALNRVLRLSKEQREKGVVAFSSGNFGQGLAAAATAAGVKSTIVMPGNNPSLRQSYHIASSSLHAVSPEYSFSAVMSA